MKETKQSGNKAAKRYIFTNHGKDGSVGGFYHIMAQTPMLAIRELITKHGKAPYKILAICAQ